MNSELKISNQTPTVLIYEENEFKNDNSMKSEKNQNKKTELTWESRLSMITMLVTFGLIPFISIRGIPVIIFSGLISMLCYSNWEASEKHSNDN